MNLRIERFGFVITISTCLIPIGYMYISFKICYIFFFNTIVYEKLLLLNLQQLIAFQVHSTPVILAKTVCAIVSFEIFCHLRIFGCCFEGEFF